MIVNMLSSLVHLPLGNIPLAIKINIKYVIFSSLPYFN